MASRRLILASRSPQRRTILEQLGIAFEIEPADVEEVEEGHPQQLALENARRKATAIAIHAPDALVVGVDTIVALGPRVYGKPADADAARATLGALSGKRHTVIGGMCLIDGDGVRTAVASTQVEFRKLDDGLIDWYVSTGEWQGRAGGYAIQGKGAALVGSIEGDYLNVVGLPLATLLDLEASLLS